VKTRILLLAVVLIFLGVSTLPARTAVYSLIMDMFNQISLKPQERGSLASFPLGTVSFDGRYAQDLTDRFSWLLKEMNEQTATPNPLREPVAAVRPGQLSFDTFCAVCHSDNREINIEGFAKTKVNELGMVAPAVITLTPQFTDGYIHQKIKYGGAVMPSLGYATTERDRWEIIRYLRELEKKP